MGRLSDSVSVPPRYPTSLIFLDESGSKATSSRFFVVAAVKLREPGRLARAIQDLRDRHGFRGEFKFAEITRGTLPVYYDLIDQVQESDAHLAACVVNRDVYNPFRGGKPPWRAHAEVASQLLVGCINRRELVSVLMDGISTPRGCSLEDTVRELVNRRLRATSVVTSACLDSRTNDTLQVADMLAGAVSSERRRVVGESGRPTSNKAKVAERLGTAFDHPGLLDGRTARVNIATYRGHKAPEGALKIVRESSPGA